MMLPRVDCEASRRTEERACHSIVRFQVQLNVVVLDMWDKYWAKALHSSSLMFWLWAACTLASVCEQLVGQLAVMLNRLGDDQLSTPPHA